MNWSPENPGWFTIRVPRDLEGWFLPVTLKPDGTYVEYDSLPPTFHCSPKAHEPALLLGPDDVMGYGFQRLMSVADGGPGEYVRKYTLILEECSEYNHTYNVVVNTNTINVVVSE